MAEWVQTSVVVVAAVATTGLVLWWVVRGTLRSRSLLPLSNWTPEHRGQGEMFSWPIGTIAILRWGDDDVNTASVCIDSDRQKEHRGEPVVYEVVFLESVTTPDVMYEQGWRCAVPANLLEPDTAALRAHKEIAALIETDSLASKEQ